MLSLIDYKLFDVRSFPLCRGPYFLELHPTDICNSNCVFCNQRDHRKYGHHLDYPFLAEFIKDLITRGLRVIRISGGGEPTVYPYITDLLALIAEYNLVLSVFSTNGLLLNRTLASKLVDASTQIVHLSLQAPTPNSWSRITGLPADKYKTMLAGIFDSAALLADTRVIASYALHEYTCQEIEEAVLLCKSNGWWFSIHDLNGYSYSKNFMNRIDDLRKTLLDLRQLYDRMSFGFYNIAELKTLSDCSNKWRDRANSNIIPDEEVCMAPWYSLLLKPNGDTYICCALTEEKHCLGNIFESCFSDIWNGPKAKHVKTEGMKLFLKKPPISRNDISYFSEPCFSYCPVQSRLHSNLQLASIIRNVI